MSSGFGYIRELDGLRGVSILLILGVHSGPLAGGSGRTSFLLGCLLALAPMASIAGIAGRTWFVPAVALGAITVTGTPLWLG
jgi:hypothetical protein